MHYIMNEKKYAEKILKSDEYEKNKNRLSATTALAKYYKSLGREKSEIRDILRGLINERVKDTREDTVNFWINKALEISWKSPLYETDSIVITKPEIDRIKQIHSVRFKDERIQKLAFTLLCLAKFAKERGIKDYWVNTGLKDIFSIAHIKGQTTERQCLLLNELYNDGYIELNPRIKSQSVRVLGIFDGEIEVEVFDINEAGLTFEQYCGKRFIKCDGCGKMVAITNGRNTFCTECAEERNREKTRKRMRELGIFLQKL